MRMLATCPNVVISVENGFLVNAAILRNQILNGNCCNRVSVIVIVGRRGRKSYTWLRPLLALGRCGYRDAWLGFTCVAAQ